MKDMREKFDWILIALVMVFLSMAFRIGESYPRAARTEWEYKLVNADAGTVKTLKEMQEQGWELTTVRLSERGYGAQYCFKRANGQQP